jgi:uncharacterized paraquat-inducible protein A
MATKARLHWFWRGTIAVLIGAIGNLILILAGLLLFTTMPGMTIYALLTRRLGPPVPDGELHCRRCNHILRGLSEPRCPECGEAI